MSHTIKVLIIDDEEAMQLGAERALQNHVISVPELDEEIDFVVDKTGNGEDGLEKIKNNQPQILLLDYKLPGMDGLNVLEKTIDRGDVKKIADLICE